MLVGHTANYSAAVEFYLIAFRLNSLGLRNQSIEDSIQRNGCEMSTIPTQVLLSFLRLIPLAQGDSTDLALFSAGL